MLVLCPNDTNVCRSSAARSSNLNRLFTEAVATIIGTRIQGLPGDHSRRSRDGVLPPLPEQRRIAEILDTLDEAIRKTEQVIAKLQQMKQGLLHDILTRGIDDNGELRDPDRHPEQFKDSPLGRIPRGWEVRPLKDLSVGGISNGVFKDKSRG